VNIANDHANTWPFLSKLLGPTTNGWRGISEPAILVPDRNAQLHPELRYVINAMPDSIPLRTNWLGVRQSIDDLGHIKVIYRLKATWITTDSNFIPDYQNHYVWASTQEKGRALSLPLGWYGGAGTSDIMAQADGAVPKLYWQGMRWLAGDYQGGCTNPEMPNFNPDARVDDGSCPPLGIGRHRSHAPNLLQVKGRRVQFNVPISGASYLQVVDLQGHSVATYTAPHAATSFDLPTDLLPGLYFLKITGAKTLLQARILIH
jgi:hypothetical protein